MSSPPQSKPGDAVLLAMWTDWHDGAVSTATNDELSFEWSMLSTDCYSWDDNDLQLAAELGKTLLERNKELETGLKQQQTVIDDQSQEIEYLSKQSVALREVNDSRLRVYEQLEVSIQELEVTNQRLLDEAGRDKKRIRSLLQSVECLELRTAELQSQLEELRCSEQAHRAAAASSAAAPASLSSSSSRGDEQSHSDGRRDSQTKVPSPLDQLTDRVAQLERLLSEVKERERQERERRQWAEAEVTTSQEECSELRQEMAALRERSVKLHTLAEEVHALEEHRLSPFLRHCSPRACSASPQMAAAAVATGSERPPAHSVWGDQDAVRWTAGASTAASTAATAATAAEQPDSAPASLISDLDAHYRVLLDHMDKYEWLLTSRPPRPATPDQPSSLSLLEELQLSAAPPPASLRAAPLRDSGPASLMLLGVASDGDASSSGFSEGSDGSRAVSRATQTPDVPICTAVPPSAPQGAMSAALQHTPQYKQLFQEIFQVLKKPAITLPVAQAATSATMMSLAAATERVQAEPVSSEEVAEPQSAPPPLGTSPPPPATSEVSPAPEACPSSGHLSLQATLSSEVVMPSEQVTALPAEPAESVESAPPAYGGRSQTAIAARTFSYTEEYERRLRASTPLASDGATEATPGGGSGCTEEFPLLVRPSEEVAKLRILERSYAEALKAGRRCFYRPTLL